MIDTVVLSIPVTKMDIKNLEQFTPTARKIFQSDRGFRQYKRNPTAIEKKLKIYVPIYTLYRRVRNSEPEIDLHIQFSIPKLIFKNNFQEVCEYDWIKVITELENKLLTNGIRINAQRLKEARVNVIHFSKNILLSKGLNSSMVLNQLYKAVDTNNKLDFTQVIFKNGGQTLHLHSNGYEFALYDKIKELQQALISPKRSIDDQGYIQLSLLDEMAYIDNYIRLELRLNTNRIIKEKINKYAPKYSGLDITFNNLFDRDLSQQMLKTYWEETIRQKYLEVSWKEEDLYEKYIKLKSVNPELTEKELSLVLTVNELIRTRGVQSMRTTLNWNKHNSYKWTRYKSFLRNIQLNTDSLYIINDIDSQLSKFSLFRSIPSKLFSVDILSNMINNDKYES